MKKWLTFFALLTMGCQGGGDRPLRIGVLDTAQILTLMPKYRDLQGNLAREQMEFQASLPKPGSDLTQEEAKVIQKDAERRQREFQKRANQTIQDAIKDIRELTNEVAKQKDLDMVVVRTPYSNSVHFYAGTDITLDVKILLQQK
jgi:Skp family chaperone for outer membrane proteins